MMKQEEELVVADDGLQSGRSIKDQLRDFQAKEKKYGRALLCDYGHALVVSKEQFS